MYPQAAGAEKTLKLTPLMLDLTYKIMTHECRLHILKLKLLRICANHGLTLVPHKGLINIIETRGNKFH